MVSPRWKHAPAGSNWGEFGPDDQLGRMNLVTPAKVREGIAEVREGRTFCLSLPLDVPGGQTMNPRRIAPRAGFPIATLLTIPTYRDAVLGYVAYTFGLGAFAAWAPRYLEERLVLPLHTADLWLGMILAVTGFTGTLVGGIIADRWPGADRAAANLKVCAVFTALAVPFALATLLTGSAAVFFAAIGVAAGGYTATHKQEAAGGPAP